jgi:hypothetical protein
MASKLRSKVLNAKDIKVEALPVAAWDCTLELRGLTGAERASLVTRATIRETVNGAEVERVDSATLNPLLVIASCFDPETGEKVFEDADAEAINNKSAGALDLVTTAVLRINGMSKDETAAMEKNSSATATDAGPSA